MIKKLVRYKRRRLWRERYDSREWRRVQESLSSRQFKLPINVELDVAIIIPGESRE